MPTLIFSLCLLACFLSSTVSTEITVKPGENVTLQCLSPRGATITLLEWSRPDPETDGYVFFFRENRLYENYQHPSFRGRVQLRDPEMKDGDVSVILKNVNINDTGTYECHVSVNSKRQELMNTINLKVTDSGQTEGHKAEGHKAEGHKAEGHKAEGHKAEGHKAEGHKAEGHKDGNLGLTVGLPVAAVLVVAVIVGFVIHKQRTQHPDQQVQYTAGVPQQV